MNNTKSELINLFKTVYETDVTPEVFFAPGRVNLIGEHTDYNGGHVFPCAISLGTYCSISLREDKKVRMENEVMLGLRKLSGIDLNNFRYKYNYDLENVFNIDELIRDGYLIIEDNYLKINKKYIYISNEILLRIFD